MSSQIMTASGLRIDPLNPEPQLMQASDIAHALSNQCRFTGHTREFYSVAEHSVRVASFLLEELDAGKDVAFIGLMHDASEAYLSDIARPVKHAAGFGDAYREIEDGLQQALSERFGIPYPYPEIIHFADNALLEAEGRDIMPDGFEFEALLNYPHTITPWEPKMARAQFLSLYTYLAGKRP